MEAAQKDLEAAQDRAGPSPVRAPVIPSAEWRERNIVDGKAATTEDPEYTVAERPSRRRSKMRGYKREVLHLRRRASVGNLRTSSARAPP